MAIRYPHRLTFLDRGTCDVCGNKGKELVHTNANRYYGWETCNKGPCNELIRTWYCQTTIAKEVLRQQFGDAVHVVRRTGDIEDSWEISGDAHIEVEGGPYWVKVKNQDQHVAKEVTVDSLAEWNPTAGRAP